MLIANRKMILASIGIAVGASCLAYYATFGAGTAHAQEGKAKSELEALRKENDLLRRSLELALDKIRAQEASLKDVTAELKTKNETTAVLPNFYTTQTMYNLNATPLFNPMWSQYNTVEYSTFLRPTNASVYLNEANLDLSNNIKDLKEAQDPGATKKAIEALEHALKELRNSIRKENPAVGPK